jgi:hypothetical protein
LGIEEWRKRYPDSVNLVSPPKTTIPNTLAAEPKSQYATVVEEVSGKNPLFGRALSAALEIVLLNDFNGVEFFGIFVFGAFDPWGSTAAELLNRIAWERFALSVRDTGREYFMHWWQTKKSLERRGAARRSPGNSEAIEVVVRPRKEKEKVQDGSILILKQCLIMSASGWESPNRGLGRNLKPILIFHGDAQAASQYWHQIHSNHQRNESIIRIRRTTA